MKSILFFSLLLFFFSCRSDNEKKAYDSVHTDSIKIPELRDTVLPKPYENAIGAYYLLGNKYFEETDSLTIQKWISEKVNAFDYQAVRKGGDNLLNNAGPGPNGSQWNPDADLLVVGTFKDSAELKKVKIYLNGKIASDLPVHYHAATNGKGLMAWFILPKGRWMNLLRPLKPGEEKLIWPDSSDYVFRPDPAYTIEIRIVAYQEQSPVELRGFFRAGFGE